MRDRDFVGCWIRRYLVEHLEIERNGSKNTVSCYRDAYGEFLPFAAARAKCSVDELGLDAVTPDVLSDYLNSVERERRCSVSTRNLRRTAILSLARYIAAKCPERVEWLRMLKTIPAKKSSSRQIAYFEKDEMEAILNAPNRATAQGRVEHALLLLMYNTGARASEVAALKIRDVASPAGSAARAHVSFTGKGQKRRINPLWAATWKAVEPFCANRSPDDPVFASRVGKAFTRFGIYELVGRNGKKAAQKVPSLRTKRLSPHTIRHTTATHLLRSGVDINSIRALLGHTSIDTTNIYAEVDMSVKEKALQKCAPPTSAKQKHWKEDSNIMRFLKEITKR